jgi:hypothetical protein
LNFIQGWVAAFFIEVKLYERINSILTRLESRVGRIGAAFVVGSVLFLLACMYVRPGYQTATGLGQHYAALARDPFAFGSSNPVAYRFLTPLLSYLVGLSGGLIVVTNLIIAFLLIVAVYACYRKLSEYPADAGIAASVIAFSLVTLTTIYYSGFCDALTYVIIFFMWFWRRHTALFWVLFVLGVFNRESIVFLVPWFLFIRFVERRSVVRWLISDAVGLAACGAVILFVRHWQAEHFRIVFSNLYYWAPLKQDLLVYVKRSWPEQILGLFSVFKLLWIFPLAAVLMYIRKRDHVEVISAFLLLICAAAQLLIAYDSSRMLTMAFMLTMIALLHLMRDNHRWIAKWAFPLLLWNLLVPQLYTAAHIIEYMHTLPGNLIMMKFFGKSVW